MTRVATPENEELLVEMARHSTAAQLEKICRLYHGVNAPTSAEAEAERRYVSSRATDDGMMAITIRLRPEEAERVLTAMESGESDDPVDGLMEMAEGHLRGEVRPARWLAGEHGAASALGSESVGAGVGRESCRSPVDISLHVDAQSLECVGTETSVGLSAETTRRLLCDAGIAPVLEDGEGRVIDAGRKMRTVSAALGRALRADGDGCEFPGCSNRRFVEAHHIEHWVDGGETVLGNLVRLCTGHHKAVHEYGFGVSRDEAGGLVFRDALGRLVSEENRLWSWPARVIEEAVWERTTTEVPGWDGMPVQWERCVDALVSASS